MLTDADPSLLGSNARQPLQNSVARKIMYNMVFPGKLVIGKAARGVEYFGVVKSAQESVSR